MFCRCPNFCGNPHGALVRSRNFNDSCIQEKTHFIFLVIFFKECWIYKEFHKLTSSDTTWERSFCSHMKETLHQISRFCRKNQISWRNLLFAMPYFSNLQFALIYFYIYFLPLFTLPLDDLPFRFISVSF
jgi:hypothetical protein